MSYAPNEFDWQEWCDLREIVEEASIGRQSPLLPQYLTHPVAIAVKAYLEDRHREQLLNDAAKALAIAKPGVDPAFAERNYWLVLGKS